MSLSGGMNGLVGAKILTELQRLNAQIEQSNRVNYDIAVMLNTLVQRDKDNA